jgi:hypothetical protein
MSIGVGIFLIAVGAILAFGIRDNDAGAVNLTVVGVVIMLAGAAGIWLSYKITNDRRRVPTDAIDPAVEEQYRTVEATHEHDQHHTRIEHRPEGTPKPAKSAKTRPQPITPQPVESELGEHFDPVQAVDKPRTPEQPQAPVEEPPVGDRTIELDPTASGLPEQPRRRTN